MRTQPKAYHFHKGARIPLANGRPIKRIKEMLSAHIIYRIGGKYKYPEGINQTVYVLEKVINDVFVFKCGHRVLASVFEDLIDQKTGLASWEYPKQLSLFNH